MIRTCVTTTKLEQQSCTLKNSFKKQISFFDLKSVSILVVFECVFCFEREAIFIALEMQSFKAVLISESVKTSFQKNVMKIHI